MSLAVIGRINRLKRQKQEIKNRKQARKERKSKKRDLTCYAQKPIEFTQEILGVIFLTQEQQQFLLHIRDYQTTNIQAAHGVGKSFLMAAVIIWWVIAVGGIAFTTAPSYDQVNDILWKEVRNLYDKNKKILGGRRTELALHYRNSQGTELTAKGFSTRNYDSNSFQGKHDKKLLLLQDEADGITTTIDNAFDSCLTGSKNKGVRIGNPLTPNSAFAKNCAISSIKVSVWNHPNVSWAYQAVQHTNGKIIHRLKSEIATLILKPKSDPESKTDPVKPQDEWDKSLPRDIIPGAVSVAWIEKIRVKYGEFSSYWMSRVEAEFPGNDVEGIIPLTWLKQARDRYDANPDYWDKLASYDRWRIGIDVGDGIDQHAIALWRGCVLYSVKTYQTSGDRQDTIRLAIKYVEPMIDELGSSYEGAVDRTGVGAGTLGTLKMHNYNFKGCAFGESAKEKDQYVDRKIELYWSLREKLRMGLIAIAPLGEIEDEVFEDLSSVRYTTNTKDKLICEPKTQTKLRLGRSPDAGESVIVSEEVEINVYFEQELASTFTLNDEIEQLAILAATHNSYDFETITAEEANKYL